MAEPNVMAQWAWISKEPGGRGYGVLASSADIDFDRYAGAYNVGLPYRDAPPGSGAGGPWLTFGHFANGTEPLLSVSAIDRSDEYDEARRPIWPTRFFLLRYAQAAAADASHQGLWNAIREVQFPAVDRKPLPLHIEPQPIEELARRVEQHGVERMAAIAALLLEGRVALTDSGLTHEDRVADLDAVLALLPYGYRTVISASTWVNNTVLHSIDLVFAEFANNQALVPLDSSAPLPMPRTKPVQAYFDLLRKSIQSYGIQSVLRRLWDAKRALQEKGPGYALAVLIEAFASPSETSAIWSEPSLTPAMRTAIRRDDADAAQAAAAAGAHEPVLFGASYPRVLRLGVRQPLYVHLYREGIRDQLDARLAELTGRLGPQRRHSEAPANTIIPRGAKLEIRPRITNVRSYPEQRTIVWRDKFTEAPFKIEYADQSTASNICTGSVAVSTNGSLIAQLPVSLPVSRRSDALFPPFRTVSTGMLRHVFGSYAREDAEIVTCFRAVYKALGIYLFVDTLDMPSGAAWEQYLEQQIERSDVFQLFWSYASAASPAVESEWQHALTVAASLPRQAEFIRPVYWTKPCPDPPELLSGINFDYFDPRIFGLSSKGSIFAVISRPLKAFRSFFRR
jgi:TIR domain